MTGSVVEKDSFESYLLTVSANRKNLQLTDPRALRAYAHPIRLELIGLLRRFGPLTATQAGEKIGESAASCSFHLRQLAKYGLVEEAGGGKGRERPWRATAVSTEWAASGTDEDTAAAGAMLSRVIVEHYFEQAIGWLDRRSEETTEWAEKAVVADHVVYLTADELAEIGEKARALLDPYLERNEDPGARPDGARPVTYVQLGFPLDEE
jgi:DNA-binding transcriptional ArsR family regulator